MTDRYIFSATGLTPPKTELLSDEENFTLRDKRRDKKL